MLAAEAELAVFGGRRLLVPRERVGVDERDDVGVGQGGVDLGTV
jgi:hypothetical protein